MGDRLGHPLSDLLPPDFVSSALLPRVLWHPCPTANDRHAWMALPATLRERLIANAEQHVGMAWPELRATAFLDFARTGNRTSYEDRHAARRAALSALVLGECVEAQGRFLDDVVNGVWAICEESFWGVPAHNYSRRHPFAAPPASVEAVGLGLPDTASPTIDLYAAETGGLLAWTWYLLRDRLAADLPIVVDRIEREVHHRLLIPYRNVDDWRWLGKDRSLPTNNWNPWIHANLLTANLLLEPDERLRADTVSRVIDGLDAFLVWYHGDGGCDEGATYWGRAGGSLFDCLDMVASASAGRLDGFQLPLVAEIGRYLYRMHIGGPWYVDFADGSAQPLPEAGVVFRFGQRIRDDRLTRQGAFLFHDITGAASQPDVRTSLGRVLHNLFDRSIETADATPPLVRDAWLDGIQVLTARERPSTTNGLFLAMKGGHNDESHNHNDVGSFIVGLDGVPVVVDVGVGTYTRQTFSPERYAVWTMRSAYHNLPLINGFEQATGARSAARDVVATVNDDVAELSLDIAAAYPPDAQILSWRRTLRLARHPGGSIQLDDDYRMRVPPRSLALHLLIWAAIDVASPGVLRCAATRPLLIRFDPGVITPSIEHIAVADDRLHAVWGDYLYRVVLSVHGPVLDGRLRLVMTAG